MTGIGRFQRTLKSAIHCTGIGLHSGEQVSMELLPAAAGTGIVFERSDLSGANEADATIPALWRNVVNTQMCTTIANDAGHKVSTIEHLMAALFGYGIDNLRVRLDAPEVPIMDGSSAPFVFLIECAGIIEQAATRRFIRIDRPVEVVEEDRYVRLLPSAQRLIEYELDYEGFSTAQGAGVFELTPAVFKEQICRARTFGFERDVAALHRQGLALGGSLDNAVVVGDDQRILNEEGLRFDDELLRHKVLDAVGDLAMAGAVILGHFQGYKSGHDLNNKLLAKLFADDISWSEMEERTLVALPRREAPRLQVVASA